MKILLSLMILFVPFSILAKQICIAPSGCRIEIDTGLCPSCIEVKEEPPIIKEEKVIVEKKPEVIISKPSSKISTDPETKISYTGCTWECIVAPCTNDMLPKGCRWVGR